MASKEIINQLKARGMSYSEIGRKLGRDSSLVSQIARGKKKGVNLEGALGDILEKRPTVREAERRINKATGKAQAVRKSKQPTPKGLQKDKKGRIKFTPESARESVFMNRMEKVASEGGKVSFRVTYLDSDGEEHETKLFERGGIYAQRFFQELRATGLGGFDWLIEKLGERGGNGNSSSNLIDVEQIVSVGITAVY